jgi:integrase/recombinase XerC
MRLRVEATEAGHRLAGDGLDVGLVNRFLEHLSARNFAVATRRAYAYDLLIFARFCAERGLSVATLTPSGVFDFLDWQSARRPREEEQWARTVVALRECRGAAATTMNRRVAALRGLSEYAVLAVVRADNPGAGGAARDDKCHQDCAKTLVRWTSG